MLQPTVPTRTALPPSPVPPHAAIGKHSLQQGPFHLSPPLAALPCPLPTPLTCCPALPSPCPAPAPLTCHFLAGIRSDKIKEEKAAAAAASKKAQKRATLNVGRDGGSAGVPRYWLAPGGGALPAAVLRLSGRDLRTQQLFNCRHACAPVRPSCTSSSTHGLKPHCPDATSMDCAALRFPPLLLLRPACAGLDDYKYGDAGDGDDFDFM